MVAAGRCAASQWPNDGGAARSSRAVPELHRADDIAELDVGRRDLQGDVVLQAGEPLGHGIDDAGRHRIDGTRHRIELGQAQRVGALEDVLACEVEVARPRGGERAEQLADGRRVHLAGQFGDGAAVVGGGVEQPGRVVGRHGREGRRRCRPW